MHPLVFRVTRVPQDSKGQCPRNHLYAAPGSGVANRFTGILLHRSERWGSGGEVKDIDGPPQRTSSNRHSDITISFPGDVRPHPRVYDDIGTGVPSHPRHTGISLNPVRPVEEDRLPILTLSSSLLSLRLDDRLGDGGLAVSPGPPDDPGKVGVPGPVGDRTVPLCLSGGTHWLTHLTGRNRSPGRPSRGWRSSRSRFGSR